MNRSLVLQQVSDPWRRDPPCDRFVIDGRWSDVPPARGARTLARGGYLLAPLVDCHTHLTVESGSDSAGAWRDSALLTDEQLQKRAIANLKMNLSSGILAVRDAGAASGAVTDLGGARMANMPHLQSSGRIIAGPGRQFEGVAHEVVGADLIHASNAEASRGGGWIKLVADAPHRDRPGSPAETDWRSDDVRAAVAAARQHGARVIYHALTPGAARIGLEAGVDSIEHGWGLATDDLMAMARLGIAWTPTARGLLDALASARAAGVAAPGFVAEGAERLRTLVPAAGSSGVRVLLGTDLAVPHGALVREMLTLVELGMAPADAVAAGTRDAWSFLRLPEVGTVGELADGLVLDRDPCEEPEALGRPAVVLRAGDVIVNRRDEAS